MPVSSANKLNTIQDAMNVQRPNFKGVVFEITHEDLPSPIDTCSNCLPTKIAESSDSERTTYSSSKAVDSTTTSSSAKTDDPATPTPSPPTTEPPPTIEAPAASDATVFSAAHRSMCSDQVLESLNFENWCDRMQIDTEALHKGQVIFSKTKQMMRHENERIVVLASRGFRRTGYLPTRKTSPPLRTRRYSIEVLSKDESCNEGWQTQVDVAYQAATEVQRYHQNEPKIRPEPIQAFPNPLRYEELNRQPVYSTLNDQATYLVLGDIVLSHKELIGMCDWLGNEAWMRDNALGMALEILDLRMNCSGRGISIVKPDSAQILCMAHNCQDGHEAAYDVYRDRLQDKRWILVPINDGIGSGEGTHWSLLIMDRIHKVVFYYDSMGVGMNRVIEEIALDVSKGLMMILGEQNHYWKWQPQEYSPDQWHHNLTRDDRGPCGPFVWMMAKTMISWIMTSQVAGNESMCNLSLPPWFPYWFKTKFSSFNVRVEMQTSVVRFKTSQEPLRLMAEHDKVATKGEDVKISQELPAVFWTPPLPRSDSSIDTYTDNDQGQDGGISLNHPERGGLSLVGEDDSDDHLADASSTTRDSPPAHDITLDDDFDMMDGLSYGSGSDGTVRKADFAGLDTDSTPTKRKSSHRFKFPQHILQGGNGLKSRKRRAEHATTGRPRPYTPPEKDVKVDAAAVPLPEARKRHSSVESYWSDMTTSP